MRFFIGQVLPYIAGSIFVFGVLYRVTVWLRTPVPFQLTLFPAPKDCGGRVASVATEFVFFRSLFHSDRSLWLWAWLLHVSLAMVIMGHIVGIYFLMNQFTLIGMTPAASQQMSAVLGTSAGIVLMAALIVLAYRRTADPILKRLSDPADYFGLMLLLAIVVTGNHMRLPDTHIDLAAVRTYMGALLTFSPAAIPDSLIFMSHFTLVNLLLIYFPFSKLMHSAGFLVNRSMLVEAPPSYPVAPGTAPRSAFAAAGPSSPVVGTGQAAAGKGG